MSIETKQSVMLEKYPHLRLVERPKKLDIPMKQTTIEAKESFGTVSGLRVLYTGETQPTYRGQSLYVIEWLEGPRKGTRSLTPIEPKEQ